MRSALLFLVFLLFVLSGCGYQFSEKAGRFSDAENRLYIELFGNKTAEPYLEDLVTNAVVTRFARKPEMEIVESWDRADVVLTGTVTGYSISAISYGPGDRILEYRSRLSVQATLRRAVDGKALWKGQVAWDDEYPTHPDKGVQEDRESEIQGLLAERVAEELYFRILENF
ncbi:LptE family protein [Desulfuromonas sp. AOP6]|uniref:LPS assembly lipoprotein LptE n=1 Tax=Desulfuromonas sp. AOP6 TaxID=1566351 RepID=UPI0012753FAF|nr:LptE family protein [Desulfuromonas sp. AOP6]BCA80008.1 hypothetical protein AOP6_1795 [Desulfuromonas sp. AOP6]